MGRMGAIALLVLGFGALLIIGAGVMVALHYFSNFSLVILVLVRRGRLGWPGDGGPAPGVPGPGSTTYSDVFCG